jgi:hypothetical protein
MSDWQPIDTAPKDGTMILVFRFHADRVRPRIHVARFYDKYNCWGTVPSNYSTQPTHWMPLPDPPVADRKLAQAGEREE